MESIVMPDEMYDEIQGTNDIEEIEDNLFNRKKRKARKKKRKARRTKRKARRAKKKVVRKARRVKRRKKIRKAVRKVGGAVKKVAKKVGGAVKLVAFAPLLPLKAMMVTALKRKGVKVSMRTRIDKLANLFYNQVVRKQQGFEDYDEIDLDSYTDDNVAPVVVGIIEAIISFIKRAKKKKESGEKLTKTEEIAVKGTEQAEESLRAKAQQQAEQEVGRTVLQGGQNLGAFFAENKIIIIAVAALLAFLMFRKK